MKKITLTIEFDEANQMVTHLDTYQGSPLSPAEYGQAAGALSLASEGLLQTMSDAYFADGGHEALSDMREFFLKTVQEGAGSTTTAVSKQALRLSDQRGGRV